MAKDEKPQQMDFRVTPTNIEDELKTSYLAYSMSVIVGRAIPDVRDGLKPVHRRILFTMHEMNNTHTTAYKKSARIVGDCFAAGTLVHTEHGLVPIEEIEVGDKVRMADGALSDVVKTYHNPPGEMLDVTRSLRDVIFSFRGSWRSTSCGQTAWITWCT